MIDEVVVSRDCLDVVDALGVGSAPRREGLFTVRDDGQLYSVERAELPEKALLHHMSPNRNGTGLRCLLERPYHIADDNLESGVPVVAIEHKVVDQVVASGVGVPRRHGAALLPQSGRGEVSAPWRRTRSFKDFRSRNRKRSWR